MLKGVNKLVVDVANPDSEVFERAIFFVKPQMKDVSPKELNRYANDFISNSGKYKKGNKLPLWFIFAVSSGFGAAVAAVVIELL